MNPYRRFVEGFDRLVREGKSLPLGGFTPLPKRTPAPDAPRVLIFSPHPDDECIIGGVALRLQREAGARIVNVAVTQGSNRARQAARWDELTAACDYLGFELVQTAPGGLEQINVKGRSGSPAQWKASVEIIARIIGEQRPDVLLFPHETDWNSSHIGTHHLLMDALALQPADYTALVVETEFWGAMATPNLMVESSVDDLTDLLTALSFHVGEVQRNPYHLLVPAWMQDNVRRGGELVGGQGGAAPDFSFCTLYRLGRWRDGRVERTYAGGRVLAASTGAGALLGW
jgi:LmbE family N-acetylglucosaminyl deacetylase